MMQDFMVHALLAAMGIAAVAGPLGCFVVWRRMAYFGDTLAHAGLLGIVLGLVAGIGPALGILLTSLLLAGLLFLFQFQRRLPTDTLLGVLSHGALAVGLIAVGFMDTGRIDLTAYLFGDILAITIADLLWIYCGGAIVLAGLAVLWNRLIAITVNEEIAIAEGAGGTGVRLAFTLLIAATVAIAIKIAGILLVTALLVVPPATARRFARGPEAMAALTVAAGVLAAVIGILASFKWDMPSGPSIVAAAVALFAFGSLVASLSLRRP